jgi:hypothetical protein
LLRLFCRGVWRESRSQEGDLEVFSYNHDALLFDGVMGVCVRRRPVVGGVNSIYVLADEL